MAGSAGMVLSASPRSHRRAALVFLAWGSAVTAGLRLRSTSHRTKNAGKHGGRTSDHNDVLALLQGMLTDAKNELSAKEATFSKLLSTCTADVKEQERVERSAWNQLASTEKSLASLKAQLSSGQAKLEKSSSEVTAAEERVRTARSDAKTASDSFNRERASLTKTLLALEQARHERKKGGVNAEEKGLNGDGGALTVMMANFESQTRADLTKAIAKYKEEKLMREDVIRSAQEALTVQQDDVVRLQESRESLRVEASRASREIAKMRDGLKSVQSGLADDRAVCAKHGEEKKTALAELSRRVSSLEDAVTSMKGDAAVSVEANEEEKEAEVAGKTEKGSQGTTEKREDAEKEENEEEAKSTTAQAQAAKKADSKRAEKVQMAGETMENEDQEDQALEQEVVGDATRASESTADEADKTDSEADDQNDDDADVLKQSGDEKNGDYALSFLQTVGFNSLRLQQALTFVSEVSPQLASLIQNSALQTSAKSASRGPFDNVAEMIKQMVRRLEQEQAEDASKDQFCRDSLKKADQKKEKLQKELKKFQARVATTEALVSEQGLNSDKTKRQLSLLAEEQKRDTTGRAAEKQQNKATLDRERANEKKLHGAVTAMQGEDANVFGMLKQLLHDTQALVQNLTQEEKQADEEFTELSDRRRVETAALSQSGEMLELERERLKTQLLQEKEDVRLTEEELQAVEQGIVSLKDECAPKALSPEEKQARRQETLESLKEALKVLQGES
ncbi:unnamed protein product [Amoebophrya sp. A25]|nr:unnamed protein product [Amoebophrya sp. A25]|eukprot:GSA25T00012270001.1